ncbi:hypothetical protein BKA64DRAFT_634932 [Cadophora sp. MPI-SDFR-AT-0126]|nr:hypothetical protein BKA64DRAFT_634932 [Leotiomycetes sp. MPI-SDFR-AT-0126]
MPPPPATKRVPTATLVADRQTIRDRVTSTIQAYPRELNFLRSPARPEGKVPEDVQFVPPRWAAGTITCGNSTYVPFKKLPDDVEAVPDAPMDDRADARNYGQVPSRGTQLRFVKKYIKLFAFHDGPPQHAAEYMNYLPALFQGSPQSGAAQWVEKSLASVEITARSLLVPKALHPICLHVVETAAAFLSMTPEDWCKQDQRIALLWEPFLAQNPWVLQWFLVMVIGDTTNLNFAFSSLAPRVQPPNFHEQQRLVALKGRFVQHQTSRPILLLDANYLFFINHDVNGPTPNYFIPRNVAPKPLLTGFRKVWGGLNHHNTVRPSRLEFADYPSYDWDIYANKKVQSALWKDLHQA